MKSFVLPLTLLVVLPLAAIYFSVRSGHLVTISIDAQELTITPRGLNKVWSFSREVTIPLDTIVGVRIVTGDDLRPRGTRLPGTYIPKLITAGTYRTDEGRSFWLAHGDRAIRIEARGTVYNAAVITVSEPEAQIRRLRRATLDKDREQP